MLHINELCAINYEDEDKSSPLLPPDLFIINDLEYIIHDINDAKSWFNNLFCYTNSGTKKTKRKYLKHSYHKEMFELKYVNIIDWQSCGDTNINITFSNNTKSNIKIRMAPKELSDAIL